MCCHVQIYPNMCEIWNMLRPNMTKILICARVVARRRADLIPDCKFLCFIMTVGMFLVHCDLFVFVALSICYNYLSVLCSHLQYMPLFWSGKVSFTVQDYFLQLFRILLGLQLHWDLKTFIYSQHIDTFLQLLWPPGHLLATLKLKAVGLKLTFMRANCWGTNQRWMIFTHLIFFGNMNKLRNDAHHDGAHLIGARRWAQVFCVFVKYYSITMMEIGLIAWLSLV